MPETTPFGLASAVLIGLGVYGLIVSPQPLRKLLALNVIGTGAFLLFGIVARRGAAAGFGADPVPQALVITGIVVAFAATALAAAMLLKLARVAGTTTLEDEPGGEGAAGGTDEAGSTGDTGTTGVR